MIMVRHLLHVVLDSDFECFTEYFLVNVHEDNWSVILFLPESLRDFSIRVIVDFLWSNLRSIALAVL